MSVGSLNPCTDVYSIGDLCGFYNAVFKTVWWNCIKAEIGNKAFISDYFNVLVVSRDTVIELQFPSQ